MIYGHAGGRLDVANGPGTQLFTETTINAPLSAAVAGNAFGSSFTSGDFNGDHYSDLAIGVPNEDLPSQIGYAGVGRHRYDLAIGVPGDLVNKPFTIPPDSSFCGGVFVFYGATGTGLDLATSQFWSQDTSGMPEVGENHDDFGLALR